MTKEYVGIRISLLPIPLAWALGTQMSFLKGLYSEQEPLTDVNDICPGKFILLENEFNISIAEVKESENGELYAEIWQENLIAGLKFDTDERHCWVSYGLYHTDSYIRREFYPEKKQRLNGL